MRPENTQKDSLLKKKKKDNNNNNGKTKMHLEQVFNLCEYS
jgi:hypothetical protein